jgi:uncharacterized coiled-coil protein SlyX
MDDDLADRVTELEIRFAYQNRMLEELSEVLAASSQRLDQLERENRRFQEMFRALAPTTPESPDE